MSVMVRLGLAVLVVSLAGCKSEYGVDGIGGNRKPGDVEYFEPGPDFRLSDNAAVIKSAREQDNESR